MTIRRSIVRSITAENRIYEAAVERGCLEIHEWRLDEHLRTKARTTRQIYFARDEARLRSSSRGSQTFLLSRLAGARGRWENPANLRATGKRHGCTRRAGFLLATR